MEIDGDTLNTVQGQFQVGMQRKSMDIQADMTNKLMQDSLEASNAMRASQGIGTKVDITV